MSDNTNISGHAEHPDRAIEAPPSFQNGTVERWYREHLVSRVEADVLDILTCLGEDDQSGTLCSL